jgi:hypothetical protein
VLSIMPRTGLAIAFAKRRFTEAGIALDPAMNLR